MFGIFECSNYSELVSGFCLRKCVDHTALVRSFNEFQTGKLEIDGSLFTLYTKPAFAEFEDGRIESGFAYLLLGSVCEYTSISEICFARVTSVPELYNMLVKARDCENFIHYFRRILYGVAATTGYDITEDTEEVMTHLGLRHGIPFGNAFVTEEAVFVYGDDLFDGWLAHDSWHVFKGSEWVIRKDLGFTGVPRSAVKEISDLPEDTVIIEDFNSNCELHQIAKALPFDKADVFEDCTLEPDESGHCRRRHPRTLLLTKYV